MLSVLRRLRCLPVLAITVLLSLPGSLHAQSENTPAFAADIERLSDSDVVASIQLTPEQRAQVLQILATRQAAMAVAETDEAKAAAAAAAEAGLLQILTEDQRRLFNTLFSGKSLKFSFRSQKWPDVLTWLAGEADLSLVMDTEPPGVFSYTDSVSYSPAQAIDLVNGWLLTRGFSLVRRERMLMCLDLKGGLPEGAIPRIVPEELPVRGRFDFVSVLFPLNDRPADMIMSEVTPLLGKYGKAELLPGTKQILVADTVLNLRAVQSVLQAVPEQPAEDLRARLMVYPTEHANPDKAGEVLRELIDGTVLVDAVAGQISVYGSAAAQLTAQKVLEQLESSQGEDARSVLEVYPAVVPDPLQLVATLQLLAPQGQFRVDATAGKLISWASAADQEKIRSSLEQLLQDQTGAGPRVVVYETEKIGAVTVSTILAGLVPTARVTVNSAGRGLVVLASDADHQRVAELLRQLQQNAEAPEQQQELKGYPVSTAFASTATSLLASVLPTVQIIPDANGSRLLILARPAEHAQVALLLKSVESAERAERTLQSYALEQLNQTTATTMLATQIPTAAVTVDAANRRLLVMAGSSDHTRVAELLDELRVPGSELKLQFYELQSTPGASAVSTLSALVPQAVVTLDATLNRLRVIATEVDHQQIVATLQTLQQAVGDTERTLQFYPVNLQVAAQTQALLASTWSDVTFRLTAEGNRLMAQVTRQRDTEIRALLDRLQQEQPFSSDRSLRLYSIHDLGGNATTVLQAAVPAASISAGAHAEQLMIVATEAEHGRVGELLQQLQQVRPTRTEKVLDVYPLHGSSASAVLRVLQPLVDTGIQMTVDPGGRQLFVRAPVDRQAEVKRLVESITAGLADRGDRETKSYVIGAPNADEVQEVLLALFPDATIVTDADRKMIVATATKAQHETIEQVSAQMRGTSTGAIRPKPQIYRLQSVDAKTVQNLLDSMYNRYDNVRATVSAETGSLIVLAREDQHVSISELIAELDVPSATAEANELAVFRCNRMDPLSVQEALQPLLPAGSRVTPDRIGRQLFVSAPSSKMASVRELVGQVLSSNGAAGDGLRTQSYWLRPYEADEAQEVLERLMPDAVLVTDAADEVLVATATPEQHQTIQEVVSQMMSREGRADAAEPRSYRLRTADGQTIALALQTMFGRTDNVRVSFDSGSNALLVVARPGQHEMIAGLVQEMEPPVSAEMPRTIEVYSLPGVDGDTVLEVIQGALRAVDEGASVSWESSTEQMVVSANSAGQAEARVVTERFQESDERETAVIQLTILSADAAVNAIEGLFGAPSSYSSRTATGSSYSRRTRYSGPIVQADEDLEQILIRATPRQMMEIRDLLTQMGEPSASVGSTAGRRSGSSMRVIPFPGDAEDTVRKIRNLWPSLRKNPIRILRPGELVPPEQPPRQERDGDSTQTEERSAPQQVPAFSSAVIPTAMKSVADEGHDEPAEPDAAAEIILIPGSGTVTIVSEDKSALDQLERLLQSMAAVSGVRRSRDFAIYQLRNAGAEDVADTVEAIYESPAGRLAFGSVVLVPETRLNALLVYGNRSDRERIEQLLEVLDSEKAPDSGRVFRTEVIAVNYASAGQILDVLSSVYQTELAAGGSRRPVTIPAGIDAEVASVLRQLNARNSAPLLTIEVQQETNSLVVKAPQSLIEELQELVTRLDESARDSRARGIRLIPLQKVNSRRVMQILGDVLVE